MPKRPVSAKDLTDEEVLKEFVRRFQCDGAVLIYSNEGIESWFGRWRNTKGRKWVKSFIKYMERDIKKISTKRDNPDGITISFH